MTPNRQTPNTSSEFFQLPNYDPEGRHVTAAGGVIGETETLASEQEVTLAQTTLQRPLGERGLALDSLANNQGVIGGAPHDTTEGQQPTFLVEAAPVGQQKPEVDSAGSPPDAAEIAAQQARSSGVIGEQPDNR